MKRVCVSAATVAVVAALAGAGSPNSSANAAASSYIVVFKDVSSVDGTTEALERQHGFKAKLKYHTALGGFAADLNEQQLERMRRNPSVRFVQADGTVQAAGYVPIAPGDFAPTGVRRVGAAIDQSQVKTKGAKIAVIDTGVDLGHSDLDARSGTDCVQPGTPAQDDNGHGTHIAGTIAARNNGSDVVGVAPGTRIFAVKVLDASGSGTFAQVICGIDWVAAHGPGTRKNIRVANMSLGGSGADDGNCGNSNGDALHMAICNATARGVTFVATAGGSSSDFSGVVPAAYDEVLTTTAMADTDGLPGGQGGSSDDRFAPFSSFAVSVADQNHTIAAPGVGILSDRLGGGTTIFSGTSMATAHVSGSAALCIGPPRKAGPCAGMTPAQVVQRLRADAAAHATPGPIPGASNGFIGDPNHPIAGRYFGFLVEASGYQ
jgi:subtilisin